MIHTDIITTKSVLLNNTILYKKTNKSNSYYKEKVKYIESIDSVNTKQPSRPSYHVGSTESVRFLLQSLLFPTVMYRLLNNVQPSHLL